MSTVPFVDLHAQYEPLKGQIHKAWDEILDSMHLFLGSNVQAFEQSFAAYCGSGDAIGISDGTMALYLALRACGVGPGDEVITVSHSFIATVEAIRLAGATPVLVDIDPLHYTMDPALIEAQITKRTRVILPVHLYGQCADMDPILAIAAKYGLYVVEDACQAHGATYKGRKAGSMGHLAAFSFYYSKNLGAYGEGGMVTANDPELAQRVRRLRDHGSSRRYEHDEIGVNGRLDELQAAVLAIKLPHLDEWNKKRRLNAALYAPYLSEIGLQPPVEAPGNQHIYHLYVIRTPQRDELRQRLSERGIGTGIHYPIPIHLQKACQDLGYAPGALPVTEAAAKEILSLPMYAELTNLQIGCVVEEIQSFLKQSVAGGR